MLCQWSDQSEFMALFMVLICGMVQVLFLSDGEQLVFTGSARLGASLTEDRCRVSFCNNVLL